MGTSVIRYQQAADAAPQWGVIRGDEIFTLALAATGHRELMHSYFNDRSGFDAAIQTEGVPVAGVSAVAPLSRDIQLICQGLNYADHRVEGGLDSGSEEGENLVFSKASSSICGPCDDIVKPAGCELLDYEIELGVLLKADLTEATTVSEDNLGQYLGGLVLANDVSARDFMFGAPALQWYKGKSQRTFCPLGPVLYLLDEGDLAQLYDLELTLKLNGAVKQQATTDLLIHKPAKTLSELSVFTNLHAGDCILTGTPGGVLVGVDLRTGLSIMLNMKNDEKRRKKFVAAQLARTPFLQAGDVLELTIKSRDGSIDLGQQRNTIVDAA